MTRTKDEKICVSMVLRATAGKKSRKEREKYAPQEVDMINS